MTKITTTTVDASGAVSTKKETFEYGQNRNLVKLTTVYSYPAYNGYTYILHYFYDNGLVSSVIDSADGVPYNSRKATWIYNDKRVVKVYSKDFETSYSWDNSARLSGFIYGDGFYQRSFSVIFNLDGNIQSSTMQQYTGDPNDIIQVSIFLNYDTKNNPYLLLAKATNQSIFIGSITGDVSNSVLSKNNPISQLDDGSISISYSYEYNSRDFPTKIISTGINGIVTTSIFEYVNCDA